MRLACLALSSLLLVAGCTEQPVELVVDLRTDLVAGEDFVAVQTVLETSGLRSDRPALGIEEFYDGQRVAEFSEVTLGVHLIEVRLLDASGSEVASRRMRVRVESPLAVTALISRDCARVSCEPGSTCVRDGCAPVDCHEELSPDTCNEPTCALDSDCAPVGASCAESRCELGTCLAAPLAGSCGADEYCDVTSGCRPDRSTCDALLGLVGYWPMDAADLAGQQVMDRSGNDRHGMVEGTPAPVAAPGRVGGALDFSGTGTAYVDLPGLPLDSSDGAASTVAMWLYREGPDVDETPLNLPATASASPPRYDLWLNSRTTGTASLCINTGAGECWGVEDAGLLGRWVHVTAIFVNGPTVGGALFIDGAPASMSCVFGTCDVSRVVESPVTLGGPDSTYAFHGMVDEVRIYDRALTADEVMTLYACAQ